MRGSSGKKRKSRSRSRSKSPSSSSQKKKKSKSRSKSPAKKKSKKGYVNQINSPLRACCKSDIMAAIKALGISLRKEIKNVKSEIIEEVHKLGKHVEVAKKAGEIKAARATKGKIVQAALTGAGLGKGNSKRHQHRSRALRDNIQGVTKSSIRKLARRGGCKRISGLVYEESRAVLKVFLENIIRDAVTYTEYARRKTVMASDVVYALKRNGRTLYGFGF
jgi:histone H4